MHLSKVNLNLLVALDALLTELHVSNAAKKVHITQSAMSNALKQLRDIFRDDLLVRSSDGFILTTRALELKPQVHQLLEQVNRLVYDQNGFDPSTSDRIFQIGMTDYMEFCVLPHLMRLRCHEAPNIEFRIRNLNQLDSEKPFEKGVIELGVGASHTTYPPNMLYQNLFTIDSAVIVARKDHPLMQKRITPTDYSRAKHIRIEFPGSNGITLTPIDLSLKKLGIVRNVAVSLGHMLPAFFMLQRSNLIITLPDFMPNHFIKKLGLASQKAAFIKRKLKIRQGWHPQHENDAGHQWLRQTIMRATQKMVQELK